MLKSFLQGKPFGHPLHPALVHFPIGLFILSLVLDLASYVGEAGNASVRGAYYTMAFGLLGALLAVTAGFADWSDIRLDHPAKKTANIHMALNLTASVLFALNFVLRIAQLGAEQTPMLNLLLSFVGVGMLLFSGYLGGTMVYDNGIGVGRHRRHTPMPRKTVDIAPYERQDGWVAVCNADDLADGQTLRVDWNGTIIAIAKKQGKVYAFQEFCTHRYGPLSEGRLRDFQVECPWHRSCFDIRTGKVTEGPAKIDLKTYQARIQAGKIMIGE